MARGDAFQIDENYSHVEGNRTVRQAAFRGFLVAVAQIIFWLAVIAGILATAYYAFTAGVSHMRSFMTSTAQPWLNSLSMGESAVLLAALLASAGLLWCLVNFPRLTAAVMAWALLTWCGWTLGAALQGIATGLAGAILVGATVAISVAEGLYEGFKLH